MTRSLLAAFKVVFPLAIFALVLAALAGAFVLYQRQGSLVLAVGGGIGAVMIIVAVFGVVALQIENNALLHRIAKGLEREGRLTGASPAVTTTPGPTLRSVPAAGGRSEPPLKRNP